MDVEPVRAKREKRQESSSPPVPIKTYKWEEVRRSRQQGGYPWTHLDKPPLQEEDITAETILKEMSRDNSKDRSGRKTPVMDEPQKILKLDSSPGSSRKLEGEDVSVHVPNFSKEISLDSEDDKPIEALILPENFKETKVTLSPKGILKRKNPELISITPISGDSPRNSKCCHPLVEKIKHMADKTIKPKTKPKTEEPQEIITLENSPGTERRERRKAAELEREIEKREDDQIEISMVMKDNSELQKNHDYEEMSEEKSASKDPSLTFDEAEDDDVDKVKSMYDTSMTAPEDVEMEDDGSPHLEITEITDDADKSEAEAKPEPLSQASDEGNDFWSKIGDHEYEPIGKPVSETELTNEDRAESPQESIPPTPSVFVSDQDPRTEDDVSSITSQERHFSRPSTDDDQLALETCETPDSLDAPSSSMAFQRQIEDRFFAETPTAERTDCEISTSQVDSSALEDLPLKRENRKRSAIGAEASKLGQQIKNQTGKLRTKIKNIKKPQINMPKRPKFTMPERPKINLPERPKFNLPERPKFNLPERPKFTMPERPKINFPDKSKFRLPERPKFTMPERPKFLEKTKFTLPERPKFTMPDKSKFKLPDRPKINFGSFGRSKEPARVDSDKGEKSTDTSSTPKKKLLDFDFRTYPRFSKFKREKKAGKSERPGTPPPRFSTVPRVTKDRKAVMSTAHWEDSSGRSGDTEPRQYGLPQGYPNQSDKDFESKLAQVDKDYNQMQEEERERIAKAKLENAEIWNAMEKSSVQRLEHRGSLPFCIPSEQIDEQPIEKDDESSAASTGHHRRGVLEEIDNDEFFLRQKGISQDNIEVGKYLSDEIRDAFRSPVNALNQMDENKRANVAYLEKTAAGPPVVYLERSMQDEFTNSYLDGEEYVEEDDQNMIEHDDGYYTFPPVRPSRSRKQKSKEEPREESVESIPAPPMFQEPKVELKKNGHRKGLFTNNFKESDILDNLNEYENESEQTKEAPSVPKRRKKNKDLNYSEEELFNASYEPEAWMKIKDLEQEMVNDEIIVHRVECVMPSVEQDLPEASPIPPRRNRSRSRGSRATSACDDDRTSRGAESLTLDSQAQLPSIDLDFMDDLDDGPGYAMVDKVVASKPMEPPPRPPAPVRRNRSVKSLSGERQFFTVPRALRESSPPKRPNRNYSTLGPSRPPRKKSTTSLTNLQSEDLTDTTQYVEIEDDDPHKDLQSGEVVDKMKHRPLPPPPRPPRGPKKKKDSDEMLDDDRFGSSEIINADLPDIEFLTDKQELMNLKVDDEDYEHDEIVEIEVSTQTDPLPDDFDYTIGMEDSYTDSQMATQVENIEDTEENSIDAEILHRGLRHFRDSSRPDSRTGRPKTPIERPKTPLGRISPAILVERRVSSPTRIGGHDEIVTEASLTVIPYEEIEPEELKHSEIWEALNANDSIDPFIQSEPKSSAVAELDPIMSEPEPSAESELEQTIVEPVIQPTVVKPATQAPPQPEPSQPEPPQPEPPQPEPLQEPPQEVKAEQPPQEIIPHPISVNINADMEVLRTQRLQVSDLEVERLNVAELQASKLLVTEIEGLSLKVTDINSNSGNIVVSGIEFSPNIFEDLFQKFSQLTASTTPAPAEPQPKAEATQETQTDVVEEQKQTEHPILEAVIQEALRETQQTVNPEDIPSTSQAPERPPPPQFPGTFPMGYFPEYSLPPQAYYRMRHYMERPDQSEEDHPMPRRRKHKRDPVSTSEEDNYRPMPRRVANRAPEPSVAELSGQLFRACQSSVGRTIRQIMSFVSSHFGGGENKKDMQMALVIVLVMIAGLILLGVGDGKPVHHHHWDFMNPPNDK